MNLGRGKGRRGSGEIKAEDLACMLIALGGGMASGQGMPWAGVKGPSGAMHRMGR